MKMKMRIAQNELEPETMVMKAQKVLLIVDDQEVVRHYLARLLKEKYAVIYQASTPAEAAAILGQWPVNYVICDYDLGSGFANGFKLIRQWKREFPLLKSGIIFSGEDFGNVEIPAEVDRVVSKDADPEIIINELTRQWNERRQTADL